MLSHPQRQGHPRDITQARRKRQRLRHSCESCWDRRVKCDGHMPCAACVRGSRECIFDPEFLAAPPKRNRERRSVTERINSHSNNSHPMALQSLVAASHPSTQATISPPMELQFNAQAFGSKEMSFIRVYQKRFHSFTPIVCSSMLKEAFYPIMLGSKEFESTQAAIAKQSAAKSATWAAAVLGASAAFDCAAVDMYEQAIEYLRDCYDYPCEEVIRAYCAVALAAYQLGDDRRFLRFKDCAQILFHEVSELSDECRVCLYYCSNRVASKLDVGIGFDAEIAQRLPFNLQVLCGVSFASHTIDVIMTTPSMDLQRRESECQQVLTFLQPVVSALRNSNHTYTNVIGRFSCFSIASYYAVSLGNDEEYLRCVDAIIALISENPRLLLCMNLVWNVTKTMIGFLRTRGQNEKAATLQCYLMQYPCYAPLGVKQLFDCDFILEDFKSVAQAVVEEEASSSDLTSGGDESNKDAVSLRRAGESGNNSQVQESESSSEDELLLLIEHAGQWFD